MKNITSESKEFLTSLNAEIVDIQDYGIHSGVKVTLNNGMTCNGYYPAWKPLHLITKSLKMEVVTPQ